MRGEKKLIRKEKWNKFSVKVPERARYANRFLKGALNESPSQVLIISEIVKKSLCSAFGCFHRSELSCCSGTRWYTPLQSGVYMQLP